MGSTKTSRSQTDLSILPICINTHGQYTTPTCPKCAYKISQIFSRVFEFALAEKPWNPRKLMYREYFRVYSNRRDISTLRRLCTALSTIWFIIWWAMILKSYASNISKTHFSTSQTCSPVLAATGVLECHWNCQILFCAVHKHAFRQSIKIVFHVPLNLCAH